jgi:hypothetical protein
MMARRHHFRSVRAAALVTAVLLGAIYCGSARLAHLDPALIGYLAATLVACFSLSWRIIAFWRRPPSAFYGRALLRAVRHPRMLGRLGLYAGRDVAAQQFIGRRHRLRWIAHLLLSWGTLVSFAVTLPLVWGLIRFEAAGGGEYVARFVGVPVARFSTHGAVGWLAFHVLHLAAVAVVGGATYFLCSRLRLRRQVGVAQWGHIAPPLLLLSVALSGLALPLAAELRPLWVFHVAQLVHEAAVVLLLVSLPFSKLSHLFIRPLHLGAQLVRGAGGAMAHCRVCHAVMAPLEQFAAVEEMLSKRGCAFDGYQQLCPACRRRQLATAQAQVLGAHFQPAPLRDRERRRMAA